MKPPPFEYHAPTDLNEALNLIGRFADDDGRVIAGGQSLVPMMALRLAFPQHLIDINGIAELSYINESDGYLHIGALARHDDFASPDTETPIGDLFSLVQQNIAHLPIRKRGTVCGSLSHADPASEWCLAAVTLDAKLDIKNATGERTVNAGAFFHGIMATDLALDEILTAVRFPVLPSGTGYGFCEFNRRVGDFGAAISLATVKLENEIITEARIGVGGAESHPRRIGEAEVALVGNRLTPGVLASAATIAARVIDPLDDPEVPPDYRRHLVDKAVLSALTQATSSQS